MFLGLGVSCEVVFLISTGIFGHFRNNPCETQSEKMIVWGHVSKNLRLFEARARQILWRSGWGQHTTFPAPCSAILPVLAHGNWRGCSHACFIGTIEVNTDTRRHPKAMANKMNCAMGWMWAFFMGDIANWQRIAM